MTTIHYRIDDWPVQTVTDDLPEQNLWMDIVMGSISTASVGKSYAIEGWGDGVDVNGPWTWRHVHSG